MKLIREIKEKKRMAISQIIILLFGIVAFSYGVVGGDDFEDEIVLSGGRITTFDSPAFKGSFVDAFTVTIEGSKSSSVDFAFSGSEVSGSGDAFSLDIFTNVVDISNQFSGTVLGQIKFNSIDDQGNIDAKIEKLGVSLDKGIIKGSSIIESAIPLEGRLNEGRFEIRGTANMLHSSDFEFESQPLAQQQEQEEAEEEEEEGEEEEEEQEQEQEQPPAALIPTVIGTGAMLLNAIEELDEEEGKINTITKDILKLPELAKLSGGLSDHPAKLGAIENAVNLGVKDALERGASDDVAKAAGTAAGKAAAENLLNEGTIDTATEAGKTAAAEFTQTALEEVAEAGLETREHGGLSIVPSLLQKAGLDYGTAGIVGHILQGAAIGAGIYFGLGALEGPLTDFLGQGGFNAARWALSAGWAAGEIAFGIAEAGGLAGGHALLLGIGVGVVAAAIVFLIAYSEEDELTVNFQCLPWQPPSGGEKCSECGKGDVPCSEYQCRSLGLGCELLNEEGKDSVCVWVSKDDITPPVIKPLDNSLPENYSYTPDSATSPPDKGTKIIYEGSDDGCVPSFTPLSFGISLDEPGTCKIDIERKPAFDDMSFTMSSGIFKYNHSYSLSVPGKDNLEKEGININSENLELYMRCKDRNNNTNIASFVYNLCIDPLPDTTQPVIASTNLINGGPVASGINNISFELYVNEPVKGCNWSRNDKAYSDMENKMDCSGADSISDMNGQGLFTCRTTLTGINEGAKNDYYFRCEDKANNTNQESFKFRIQGTHPLVIDSLSLNGKPNNTKVKDSTDSVKVKLIVQTSQGYDEGASMCYYSRANSEGRPGTYRQFLNQSWTHTHSQDLYLAEGNYTYYVRCVDLGGNADVENLSFEIETDTNPPTVIRAYPEGSYLKIITGEKAECVYNTQKDISCNYAFDEGIKMTTLSDEPETEHFVSWNTESDFYIKCQDEFSNRPAPDECNIIVHLD